MWRRSTAPTTIISPNPASRVWRGRCGPQLRSIRVPPARCLRPRASSAGERRGARKPMAVYTVHEPPPRGAAAPDPERFVFVRDRFSFWALLLGPIWMLWHRMWVVLVGYGLVVAALGWVLRAMHAPATVALLVSA